jgi:hypothetical protein
MRLTISVRAHECPEQSQAASLRSLSRSREKALKRSLRA